MIGKNIHNVIRTTFDPYLARWIYRMDIGTVKITVSMKSAVSGGNLQETVPSRPQCRTVAT